MIRCFVRDIYDLCKVKGHLRITLLATISVGQDKFIHKMIQLTDIGFPVPKVERLSTDDVSNPIGNSRVKRGYWPYQVLSTYSYSPTMR
jgi:hypothetical protein